MGLERNDERRAAGPPGGPGPSCCSRPSSAKTRRAGSSTPGRSLMARATVSRRAESRSARCGRVACPPPRRPRRPAGRRQPAAGPARAGSERADRVRGPRPDRRAGRAPLACLPCHPHRDGDVRRVDRPRLGERRPRGDAAAGRGQTKPGGRRCAVRCPSRWPRRGARRGRVARQRADRAPRTDEVPLASRTAPVAPEHRAPAEPRMTGRRTNALRASGGLVTRERLERHGAGALADDELLALLVGANSAHTAGALLKACGTARQLAHGSAGDLARIDGMTARAGRQCCRPRRAGPPHPHAATAGTQAPRRAPGGRRAAAAGLRRQPRGASASSASLRRTACSAPGRSSGRPRCTARQPSGSPVRVSARITWSRTSIPIRVPACCSRSVRATSSTLGAGSPRGGYVARNILQSIFRLAARR